MTIQQRNGSTEELRPGVNSSMAAGFAPTAPTFAGWLQAAKVQLQVSESSETDRKPKRYLAKEDEKTNLPVTLTPNVSWQRFYLLPPDYIVNTNISQTKFSIKENGYMNAKNIIIVLFKTF